MSPKHAYHLDEDKKPDRPLTDKMERFCQAYVLDPVGTRAAREAGYAPRAAGQMAYNLLRNEKITNRIAEIREDLPPSINANMVVKGLAKIAFADLRGVVDEDGKPLNPADLPEDLAASLKSVKLKNTKRSGDDWEEESDETEYKLESRTSALTTLAKIQGLMDGEDSRAEVHIHLHSEDQDLL